MTNKGFTLTELLIAMVVGAIILLVIGTVATIGLSSFSRLRSEGEFRNDATFGLDLMQRYARHAKNIVTDSGNLKFVGDTSNITFIVVNDGKNLTYANSTTSGVTNYNIFSLKESGELMALTWVIDGSLVHVTLSGQRKREKTSSSTVPFEFKTSIMRRN